MELMDVLIFCGIYSSVVIYSLWITVFEKVDHKVSKT